MRTIQMRDVELKKSQNCSHSSLSKEYHLGTATGDYICDDCGKAGFGRNWPKEELEAKKKL